MIIEGTGFVNGHTTVTVDGHAAATYGATSTQILFTVPFLLSGQSAQLEVHVDAAGVVSQAVTIAASTPGIFSAQSALFSGQRPQNQGVGLQIS